MAQYSPTNVCNFFHDRFRVSENPNWHYELYLLAALLRHPDPKHLSPVNKDVHNKPEFKTGWSALEEGVLGHNFEG